MSHQPPVIGLALGGGATLGAAHVGVLRALSEAGVKPARLAGTSIGAVVAALSAFEVPLDEIEAIANDMDWLDVARLRLSRLGLVSNENLGKLVERRLGRVQLEDAPTPVATVATDINDGSEVVMHEGDLVSAVRASTCIPGLFIPIEREGRLLVDGGLVDNVPVGPLRTLGAEYLIAVDLSQGQCFEPVSHIADVLINTMRIVVQNGSGLHARSADLVIAPDLSSYSLTNTKRSADLIREGYDAARAALENNPLPEAGATS